MKIENLSENLCRRILEFQAIAGRIHQEAVVEWDARQVGLFSTNKWKMWIEFVEIMVQMGVNGG